MRRAVPRYVERAILALSHPKHGIRIAESLAHAMPHCTWYVGTALTNAYETFKSKPAPQEGEAK